MGTAVRDRDRGERRFCGPRKTRPCRRGGWLGFGGTGFVKSTRSRRTGRMQVVYDVHGSLHVLEVNHYLLPVILAKTKLFFCVVTS